MFIFYDHRRDRMPLRARDGTAPPCVLHVLVYALATARDSFSAPAAAQKGAVNPELRFLVGGGNASPETNPPSNVHGACSSPFGSKAYG